MGLEFAVEELYATGWTALDSAGCAHLSDGRCFPSPARVASEFEAAGFDFSVRHIQLFDCYRAEWKERGGSISGAVVGQTESEAAVYALSQLRRNMTAATIA